MHGQMMQRPLLISKLLVHAERHHGEQQVVSRRVEGDVHRQSYSQLAERSRRMAMPWPCAVSSSETASLRWHGMATATWSCTTRGPARAPCCTR